MRGFFDYKYFLYNFTIYKIYRMIKNYFYIILLAVFFCSLSMNAQENKTQNNPNSSSVIEGLNLYPNPVYNGKITITTKNDGEKEIIIFDLLGKKVLQTNLNANSRELNISSLIPGVYIIKINEQNSSATRKLIVR